MPDLLGAHNVVPMPRKAFSYLVLWRQGSRWLKSTGGWESTLEASPGFRVDLTVVATLSGKLVPQPGDPRTEVGGFNVRIQAVDDPPPAPTDRARHL